MVHGYEMIAWDPQRQIFFSMPNHHGYYKKALPTVADFRRRNARLLNRNAASPWRFDPWNRSWHRLKTPTGSPKSGYGDVLMYIPSKQMLFFYHHKKVSYYDPLKNRWQFANPNGPVPPFGIDPTACHDAIRNRVYIGGGDYPVAKGSNALWIYEVQTESWADSRPAGSPGDNRYGTNVAVMTCDTRSDRVYLFRHAGKLKGVFVYDAKKRLEYRRHPVTQILAGPECRQRVLSPRSNGPYFSFGE